MWSGPELVGRTVKMARKILDDAPVSARGRSGEVPTLDFLQHQFAKLGHKNLLITRPYRLQTANAAVIVRAVSAVRVRSNGVVGDYSQEVPSVT